MTKPTLHGERVTLRPIRPDDIDAYLALVQDEEGLRLTGTPSRFTREQTEGWLRTIAEREDRVDLAIVPQGSEELVGEVVLNEIDDDNRSANIRIGIRQPHTGRGYGSEAMRLMLGHAFEQLGLHRVSLEVFSFNPRALHVYEKLGFRREGVLRDTLLLDGVYHDAIVMSMLEDEYRDESKK
ncbi:MAG TPA: GNAT family protein [Roseiflexaceae bacterium]|nr:GNAT family protein [Roseiflexaceae bacterium]